MRLRCSGVDYFHHLLHRLILDHGGAGNHGQVRVVLEGGIDVAAVARAWTRLGDQAWILGARFRQGIRGPYWSVRPGTSLVLERGEDLTALGERQLREGLEEQGPRMRLGYAHGAGPGLVLTWDHRLCDARAAMTILARLPELAAGTPLRDTWWVRGHRQVPGLPPDLAARGAQARQSVAYLKPHRHARLWRPAVEAGNRAAPLTRLQLVLSPAQTAAMDSRQLSASGRFAETPFLLACLAAAMEDVGGLRGDPLFPVAVDARPRLGGPILANCHSFLFLRVRSGLASTDLGAAARALKDAHRIWVAQDVAVKMACAMEFFPLVGERLARAQLGYFRAGVAASCLVANTGQTILPTQLFGAAVKGISHAAAVPGMPGLAALFHRQGMRLCCDLIAADQVATAMPLERLSQRLRYQMLERPLIVNPTTTLIRR